MAFFDFQYVGFGCGLSDVAKLFTCSVERDLLFLDDEEEEGEDKEKRMAMGMGKGEERLLKHYQHILENVSGRKYSWEILVMHWYVFFHFFVFFLFLSFFFACNNPTYLSSDIHDKIRQIDYMYLLLQLTHPSVTGKLHLSTGYVFKLLGVSCFCTFIYKVPGYITKSQADF